MCVYPYPELHLRCFATPVNALQHATNYLTARVRVLLFHSKDQLHTVEEMDHPSSYLGFHADTSKSAGRMYALFRNGLIGPPSKDLLG